MDDTNEADLVSGLDERIDQALRRVVGLLRRDRSSLAAEIESGDLAAIEQRFAELQAARAGDAEIEAATEEVVRLRSLRRMALAGELLQESAGE